MVGEKAPPLPIPHTDPHAHVRPGGPFLFSSASTRQSSGEAADLSLGLPSAPPHLACQVTCGAAEYEQQLKLAGREKHNPEGSLVLEPSRPAGHLGCPQGPRKRSTRWGVKSGHSATVMMS